MSFKASMSAALFLALSGCTIVPTQVQGDVSIDITIEVHLAAPGRRDVE